jgi:hypothetical protein
MLSHRHVQLNRDLFLTASHRRITLTSAQPLGSRSPVLNHRHVQLNRSLSHYVYTGESSGVSHHLNSLHRGGQYIVSSLSQNDTPNSWASPHRGTQHSISVSERNHTPNSWASLHRGTQHSISVSERNHTPNSWASSPLTQGHNVPSLSQRGTTHPSHGHTQLMGSLSGRLTQSVSWRMSHAAVIINKSINNMLCLDHSPPGQCLSTNTLTIHDAIYQHSLLTKEVTTSPSTKGVISTSPNLSLKYVNFILDRGFVKISAICSSVEIY